MNQTIKNRIEQIKAGQVPSGYIISTCGVVPQNWECKLLNKLAKIYDGIHTTPNYTDNGVKFVSVENIKNLASSSKYISEKDFTQLYKIKPQKNDILMTRIGDIGTPVLVNTEEKLAYYVTLALIRCIDKLIDFKYLSQAIKSNYFQKELYKKTLHVAFPKKINLEDIGKSKLLLTSKVEQERIAEVLGTWDKAIELKEKLIEKLEARKKALMQKLLTPKAGWSEKKLGNLCTVFKGTQINGSELTTEGLFPMLNGGIAESGYTNNCNQKAGTITISEGGNSCGFVQIIRVDFWCGGHCYALIECKVDSLLLYYYLKWQENNIKSLRVGSGLPNIQKTAIENLKVILPTKNVEQQRITNILSAADKEIDLHKRELEKLKLQKKSLMQLLLTGIVRTI